MTQRFPLRVAPWTVLALLSTLLGAPPLAAEDAVRLLGPRADDTTVAGRVRLKAGAWRLDDANDDGVLQITADGTVLDLREAALVGADDDTPADTYRGVGIRVVGAKDVIIRGGLVRGFRVGIEAVDAPGLVIEGVDVSENRRDRLRSTPAREDPSDWLWPHTNDGGEWTSRYGGGIALTGCDRPTVRRCRGQFGQNGLLLTRCTRARVHDNDFSFNSGWGIALYRTHRSTVSNNHCDFCVRGYSHGVYHRGQDSAGILVFEQSCDNAFVGNSATHSGDGFFLYAGHETTQKTGRGGSNRNVVYDNDFSYAVANGIEATFSEDNVFVRNRLDGCDHGVWAGYSRRTLIGGNTMRDCLTAGISIEHGQQNRIVHNDIRGGPVGVHLWWDHDEAFVDGPFGKAGDTSSSKNVLVGNDILTDRVAVKLGKDTGTSLRWNQLFAREALLELGEGTTLGAVEHNLFRGPRSASRPAPALVRGAAAAAFPLATTNQRRGRITAPDGVDLDGLDEVLRLVRPAPRLPTRPEVPGRGPKRRPKDAPKGRAQMRVGPWGPLDPREPALVQHAKHARGPHATVELLGEGTWTIIAERGSSPLHIADAADAEGTGIHQDRPRPLPVRLRIGRSPLYARGNPWHALVRYRVEFDVAGRRFTAEGTVLDGGWVVTHFPWKNDPRTETEAWRKEAEAAHAGEGFNRPDGSRRRVWALDHAWRTGGPEGVRPDRFGTVATRPLRLAKGRYRIRTVSDDGVRVWVNDTLVIDHWTQHAPTEDVGEFEVEEGTHSVRVEHFELDGWAHLSVGLEPVDPPRAKDD